MNFSLTIQTHFKVMKDHWTQSGSLGLGSSNLPFRILVWALLKFQKGLAQEKLNLRHLALMVFYGKCSLL